MGRIKRGEFKRIDNYPFTANARVERELSIPAKFIQALWLSLTGELTISGVTVPGRIHADAAANLIRTVQLNTDGDPLKLGSFGAFLRIAQRYHQSGGLNDGLVSAAAGVYPFECLVPLLFEFPSSVNPLDTLIDGRFLKNLTLTVQWNAAADLVVGNTSTLALANVNLDVYSQHTEPFPIKGAGFWRAEELESTYTDITTATERRLQVPYKLGSAMRAIQLRAVDGADLSDDVLDQITLRINGSEQPYENIEDDTLRGWTLYQFGLENEAQGYYHIELAEGGRVLTTGVGSQRSIINNLDVLADTTAPVGAGSIVAHVVQYVPPDGTGQVAQR